MSDAILDAILLFITVPGVSALIGWGTNWAAVEMIFWPARFIGMGALGWQGIIYKQSHKFATGIATMATENLITAREIVERLDTKEGEELLAKALDSHNEELCKEAAEVFLPGQTAVWDTLPPHVRAMVTTQVQRTSREICREVLDRLRTEADDIIEVDKLVYTQLSGSNTDRLAEFTRRIGHKEFKFIEYFGGIFGLGIGLLQIPIWQITQIWWLMPIVGAFVGLITNWLAIEMIFRPHEPRKYLGLFRYQGLFPKRQAEIAADYGEVSAAEILNARNLVQHVAEGEGGARIAALVSETISRRIDAEWDKVRPMIPIPVTPEMLVRLKAVVAAQLMKTLPKVQPMLEAYIEQKLEVARTVKERLSSLSKPQFERVLRGIFEEDELTLIIVGGVLGAIVGVIQGMIVLSL